MVVLLLQQQQQKGTTETTENTENKHQAPSSQQHPAVVGQQVAVREPERACASGRSLPNVREANAPPAVQGFAPA
ncbi:MAG: hypothetical protein ACK53T_01805, partial [Planctomycetota bacterium]